MDQLPAAVCEQCPSLLFFESPNKRRRLRFRQSYRTADRPPRIDLTGLDLAQDTSSMKCRAEAAADLEKLLLALDDLNLKKLSPSIEELLWFLRLEDPATKEETRSTIQNILTNDPEKTVYLIRLLLRYGIAFDETALNERLEQHRKFGGWSPEEAFAALALQLRTGDPKIIATFLDKYGKDVSAAIPNPEALSVLEIEVKAKSGDTDGARSVLAEKEKFLAPEARARLMEIIEEQEGKSDPLDNAKRRYADKKNPEDLKEICALLERQQDFKALSTYAVQLAECTRTLADLKAALNVLFRAHKYREAQDLIDHLADVHHGNSGVEEFQAHAYFFTGQVNEAARILEKAFPGSLKLEIVQLEIFTAIERGNWEHVRG